MAPQTFQNLKLKQRMGGGAQCRQLIAAAITGINLPWPPSGLDSRLQMTQKLETDSSVVNISSSNGTVIRISGGETCPKDTFNM